MYGYVYVHIYEYIDEEVLSILFSNQNLTDNKKITLFKLLKRRVTKNEYVSMEPSP